VFLPFVNRVGSRRVKIAIVQKAIETHLWELEHRTLGTNIMELPVLWEYLPMVDIQLPNVIYMERLITFKTEKMFLARQCQ